MTSFDGRFVFPTKEWVNIDICKDCYQKLFAIVSKKKINDFASKTYSFMKGVTKNVIF